MRRRGVLIAVLVSASLLVAAPSANAAKVRRVRDAGTFTHFASRTSNFSTRPDVTYNGGATIHHVKIVPVFWGTGTYVTGVDAPVAPNLADFTGNLVQSSWMDLLSEYSAHSSGPDNSIYRGSTVPSVTITPSAANDDSGPCNTNPVDDVNNIRPELAAQIDNSNVAPPDPDTLYVLMFHQGQCITQAGFNSQANFCAYHGSMVHNAQAIRYVVLPYDASTLGCGAAIGFGNITSVLSHEVAESVTDPDGGSWFAPLYGEVADICNHKNTHLTTPAKVKYIVQTVWSAQQHKCATSGPRRFVNVGSASIVEGNTGQRTLQVPITLSAPDGGEPLTVSYSVTGGNAVANQDFVPPAPFSTVDWNPFTVPTDKKTVTKMISIPIIGNTTVDGNRFFNVIVNAGDGYGTGHNIGTETIIEDDPNGGNAVSVGDASAVVGAAGNGMMWFPVTLSEPAVGTVSVQYTVTPGTALASQYKAAKSGTVTFTAGQTSAAIQVTVKSQKIAPTTDTQFSVSLLSPNGAVFGRADATGTLVAP